MLNVWIFSLDLNHFECDIGSIFVFIHSHSHRFIITQYFSSQPYFDNFLFINTFFEIENSFPSRSVCTMLSYRFLPINVCIESHTSYQIDNVCFVWRCLSCVLLSYSEFILWLFLFSFRFDFVCFIFLFVCKKINYIGSTIYIGRKGEKNQNYRK